MSIGFNLSIGVLSGYSYQGDETQAYEEMKAIALEYINSGRFAAYMNLRYASKNENVAAFAEIYKAEQYSPISFDDEKQVIFICCSGSGDSRRLKECAAMLLCTYVAGQMAKREIAVNLETS